MDDFKKKWDKWAVGNRMIFVSTCVSTFSMLLSWVDIGFASRNGLHQGTFLLLGLYVYPIMKLFKNQNINKLWGRLCSIGSLVGVIIYIGSKTIELFGTTINAASTGAYIFLLSSIVFIIGIEKYTTTHSE